MPRWILGVCTLGLCVSLSACGPDYRQEQIASAIQEICAKEHGLDVSVRLQGQTLAVYLHHEDVLESLAGRVQLAATANEILGDLIEPIHRVLLSTKPRMQFYVILVSDPTVPGVYITLVRYVEDIMRANVSSIPPTELFSRTILELQASETPVLDFNQIVLRDIQLNEFLAWQLGKRIQERLTERLRDSGMLPSGVAQCTGAFANGEFIFTVRLPSGEGSEQPQEGIQDLFEAATDVVADVLGAYEFEQFESIRFIHPATGHSLFLPKTQLEMLR